MPWLILSVVVAIWGTRLVQGAREPDLHLELPDRGPAQHDPEGAAGRRQSRTAEGAVFAFTYLSYTGTGILIAAIIAGLMMRFSPLRLIQAYGETLWVVRYSLLTIVAMLAIGTLTRYSGLDATLGLAFANTGFLYPFFGTLLGWLGVALTGSDTASNVLFGSLQQITAEQLQKQGLVA